MGSNLSASEKTRNSEVKSIVASANKENRRESYPEQHVAGKERKNILHV